MKKVLEGTILVILVIMLILGIYARLFHHHGTKESESTSSTTTTTEVISTSSPEVETTVTPTIDPSVFTDTDSYLLLANKKHKLPDGYEPSDLVQPNVLGSGASLRKTAAQALEEMFTAAKEDGVTLRLISGYRSESEQSYLYYTVYGGGEVADAKSSRPGYSDHQTGLAADIGATVERENETGCDSLTTDSDSNGDNRACFGNVTEGTWLREHAHEYGFIMRYPKGKYEITGYTYEPWHFRYVGIEYATAIYNVDEYESFEEYFNVSGGMYEE